jgi:hypothetical protein
MQVFLPTFLQATLLLGICLNVAQAATTQELFGEISIRPGQVHEVRFESEPPPVGREAVLALNARLVFERPAGYALALRLRLNGKPLTDERVLNKHGRELLVSGEVKSTAAGNRFVTDYAPDFDVTDKSANYALRNAKATLLELRVTDLLQPGSNALVIENAIDMPSAFVLVVGRGRLELRASIEKRAPKSPPTGTLAVYVPTAEHKVGYELREEMDGVVTLQLNGMAVRIKSQFSTPEGKWRQASNRFFRLQRKLERRDEAVIVRDTFTNLTNENLPLMRRYEATTTGGFKKLWLAGISPVSGDGAKSEPSNPTTFGVIEEMGVGLLPLDDVSLVHVSNYSDGNMLGLADNNLTLQPHGTYTAEWAIVPTAAPDYFAFVNAVRRLRDVNFAIDGSFAFLRADADSVGRWSDEELVNFIRNKSAKYVCITMNNTDHGTTFQSRDFSEWRKEIAQRRRLTPDVKQLAYFHCFIDVTKEASSRFSDERLLRSDGLQADYDDSQVYPLFIPTASNKYGPAVAKNVSIILDTLKLDGVYWDEMEHSRYPYHYGDPWDGVSCDIDPNTMKIGRLKSSVTLLTQPWRLQTARHILDRGVLIANGGSPHTRTMMQLRFPEFVETGSISNCTHAQLYTPIALGDHLTERDAQDAYRVMQEALNYGCLYYWYFDLTVRPSYPTLTKYMFPTTPLELHEGVIIGQERIVTNRSGMFGWDDDSQHEIHVFDAQGREVSDITSPTVARTIRQNSKTLSELRLAEGWSAAIVRRKATSRQKSP